MHCESQVHLRAHRLATTLWTRQRHAEAVQLLGLPALHFRKHLPKDPLTGECQFAHSVSQIALLDAGLGTMDAMTRVLAPKQRADLVQAARLGLGLMIRGFKAEHVLVHRAQANAQTTLPHSPEVLMPAQTL